jgi:hypothetical protein
MALAPGMIRTIAGTGEKGYELTDGRVLSVPLWWIPTLHNATPEEREKYEINRSRTMIIWDPDKCSINDEVCIADYLSPGK